MYLDSSGSFSGGFEVGSHVCGCGGRCGGVSEINFVRRFVEGEGERGKQV